MVFYIKKNNSLHNNDMQKMLLVVWVEIKLLKQKITSLKKDYKNHVKKIYQYIAKYIKFISTKNKFNFNRKLLFTSYTFWTLRFNIFYQQFKYKKKHSIFFLTSEMQKPIIIEPLTSFKVIEFENKSLEKNLYITEIFKKLKNYEQYFLFFKKLYPKDTIKQFSPQLRSIIEFILLSNEINIIINTEIFKRLNSMEKEIINLKKISIRLIKEKKLNFIKKQKIENLKTTRRIKRYLSKKKVKFSILNKEKFIILNNLKPKGTLSQKFSVARDRIAHCLMGVYGLSIKDFKYINLRQIDNFYNKRSIFVKFLERGFPGKIELPYIEEANSILNKTYPDYLFVTNFVKKKIKKFHKKLEKKFGGNWQRLGYSEIWGTISREHFSRRINSQLKYIGQKVLFPSKDIKSYSYKRGIANTIFKKKGMSAAKKAFSQKHLDIIDLPSLPKELNITLLKEYFKIGLTDDS